MRTRTRSIFIMLFFVASLLLIATGSTVAETITIKAASYNLEADYFAQNVWIPFAEAIEKKSNGRVKFKWYWGGTLVKAEQTYDAVRTGLVDMIPLVALFYQESRFPVGRVMTLPFLYSSSLQGNRIFREAYETIPEFRDEYKDVQILWPHMSDLTNISTSSPAAKTMNDLKGHTYWGGSKLAFQVIELLGGTPRMVKMEDLFTAIQTKALDGAFFPTAPLAAFKLTDVLNHHTVVNLQAGLLPAMFNKKAWSKLPKDIQAMITESLASASDFSGTLVDNRRAYVLKQLGARGDEIYHLPKAEKDLWRKAVQPTYDEWVKDVNDKGMDGQAILDKILALVKKHDGGTVEAADWWPKNWAK